MHHLTMLNWIELKTWMASVNCFLRAALTFASAARGGLFGDAARRYAVLAQLDQARAVTATIAVTSNLY